MDTLCLNKQALGKLTEGIVLLDDQGRPLSATRASQPWLRQCIERAPALARMIAASKAGSLKLPATVDLCVEGEDAHEAPEQTWLIANAGAGHALLIRPRPAEATQMPADESRFLRLLGMGVREEVSRLGAMLRDCTQAPGGAALILRQSVYLDTLLGEIGELSELHQRDEVFFEERLSLPDMVRELILGLRQRRLEGNVSYVLECGEAPPPGPVYGNAHWLGKALFTLLAGVEQSCPQLGRVQIHLRQLGDFIVLGASAGNGHSVSAPPAPASGMDAHTASASHALSMRICRRVIKLHGGQLNLRTSAQTDEAEDTGRAIESFTLSLPTGLPAQDRSRLSCAKCRITFQSVQYARDLAKMMAQPPSSTESNEKGRL